MTTDAIRFDAAIGNCVFSALVYLAFGWALFIAWDVRMGASLTVHAFTTLCGLCIATILFRRSRRFWSALTEVSETPDHSKSAMAGRVFDAGCCALLFATGYALASCALSGGVTLFAIFSIALSFVPWMKLGFCRRHFILACAIIEAGAALQLLAARTPANPVLLALPAWVLWIVACISLFRRT